jgi:integrase
MQQKVQRASTLVGQMRALLDQREISDNVKKAWLYWARSLMLFHGGRDPESLDCAEVEAFLKHLEVDRRISSASQRQAIEAIRCLVEEVLGLDLPELDALLDSRLRRAAPSVLSPREVQLLLGSMEGTDWLIASLVYGAGLRLMECVRLRVRDIEGERIIVRDRNGRFKRDTVLPVRLREPLRAHLEDRKLEHIRELADGYGAAQLPGPAAGAWATARSWAMQFVFPGPYLSASPNDPNRCWRSHYPEPEARHAIEAAGRKAGLKVQVSGNTLRNSFALHLIERGVAVADVERLLGLEREEAGTDRQALNAGSISVSPVDRLATH